jgi:hypothetical protein
LEAVLLEVVREGTGGAAEACIAAARDLRYPGGTSVWFDRFLDRAAEENPRIAKFLQSKKTRTAGDRAALDLALS